jgi:hypothetical protein
LLDELDGGALTRIRFAKIGYGRSRRINNLTDFCRRDLYAGAVRLHPVDDILRPQMGGIGCGALRPERSSVECDATVNLARRHAPTAQFPGEAPSRPSTETRGTSR